MGRGSRTFTLWTDIGCPWSHAAVWRWRQERARRNLQDEAHLDIRCFPLELFNRRATPKRVLDAEIPVAGSLAPEAGWQVWQRQTYDYAVTTLLAMEAVQAAKVQGLEASEELDFALRRALFGESLNISLHHQIVEIAQTCDKVDGREVRRALELGTARHTIFDDMAEAESSAIKGSPHFFLDDHDWHNPGVQMKWVGKAGKGFPVIEKDDPGIYGDMFDLWENES